MAGTIKNPPKNPCYSELQEILLPIFFSLFGCYRLCLWISTTKNESHPAI